MATLEQALRRSHDWAIDRIHELAEISEYEDARAIQCEFGEWLDSNIPEHEVYSLAYLGED
jgi:hypothetical protein